MKTYVEGNKSERDCVALNNYIEKTIDKVMKILTHTKENLDSTDEFGTVFNLLMAKNDLSTLLNNLTDTDE